MKDVETVDWTEFQRRFRWKQGEHITLVGPTGLGKTTLAKLLLPRRDYVVVFATKARDPIITELEQDGYKRVTSFDGTFAVHKRQVLAPPRSADLSRTKINQRRSFREAMQVAYDRGSWTVVIDEGKYICDYLGLSSEVELLLQQGRTLGVSLVTAVQRPVKIPLACYDQATHLFFWRDTDEANVKRLGGLGGQDRKQVQQAVSGLDLYEVLYLNTRTGTLLKTKADIGR